MNVSLRVETHDKKLVSDIMGNPETVEVGMKTEIPGVMEITLDPMVIRKGFGLPEILVFTLTFGVDVGASVLGAWLYGKLKGRVEKTEIDRVEIQLEKGEVTKIIYEKIRKSKGGE